ncbi:MAG: carcinine hydrolase/isopenicillin-N N-acyltransferase family protein [Pirellulales bacterium]
MTDDSSSAPANKSPNESGQGPVAAPRRRRRAVLRWALTLTLAILLVAVWSVRDHLRTLRSLRRIPDSNAYVIDYYGDYNLAKIRREGVDVQDLEGTYIRAFFPRWLQPVVERVKRAYVPRPIQTLPTAAPAHHCSTLAIQTSAGSFFARNFDYGNDACLIVRIHDDEGIASIAVIDLQYLNLNRPDLDETYLWERLPLLFAPYYVMDGVNRHGVAVADMSVPDAAPPAAATKPAMTQSTLMRLILDEARTVDEALELAQSYQIHFVQHPEHLMIADADGRSCVVEWVAGQLQATRSDRPWQVCTNHVVWSRTEAQNDAACERYRIGSAAADEAAGPAADSRLAAKLQLDDVQRLVQRMSVEGWTMWTSVYDLKRRELRVLYRSRETSSYEDRLAE